MSDQTIQAPTPIAEQPNLDAVKRMRIEMGATPVEFATEHLEACRPELIEAMKCLDSTEYRDLHYVLGGFVNQLDEFRALLVKRGQG